MNANRPGRPVRFQSMGDKARITKDSWLDDEFVRRVSAALARRAGIAAMDLHGFLRRSSPSLRALFLDVIQSEVEMNGLDPRFSARPAIEPEVEEQAA